MEESVMPDPVLGCPVSDTSHDDHNDDSDVSMIDSDSDSSMDVSAPDLSMLDHFLFLKFTTSRETQHCHPPSTEMTEACKVKALIKSNTKNHPFAPATQIIESVIWEIIDPYVPCQALSQPSALRRGCNRQCANGRPKHPQDLEFQMNM
ncbi:hypothetical protein LSH36_64g00024 [Paralvinella palmiformis]|uniref:Uncharacterized protein n=1 Tax=Paralvinella palmiformis TaxID=53620 RepID=A0AAD9K4F9_9ANNE|nr:hypothetical protein LSH36_64g00024 [Paralvinella palmiformis]